MSNEMVCTQCGHVGSTTTFTKGHFAVELILWLCFLVPGFIYSVWRLTTRREVCPVCGNAHMLPRNAPMAQKFIQENLPELSRELKEAPYLPSRRANAIGNSLGRLVGKILR